MHQKVDMLTLIYARKRTILRIFMFYLLTFFHANYNNVWNTKRKKEKKNKTFLCHGPMTFVTREPYIPLSWQNSLDHDIG